MPKTLFIFIAFFLSFFSVKGAYVEHQLYVRLSAEAADSIIRKDGSVNQEQFQDWIHLVLEDIEVTDVRVPFFKAYGTPLQRVIQITVGPSLDADALLSILGQHNSVDYAEKVGQGMFFDYYEPDDLGTDTYLGQWYLHTIQAPEAWSISRGNRQVKVAIVDGGVDLSHEDLKDVIWTNPGEIPDNGIDDDGNGYKDDVHGYDIAENDGDPNPDAVENFHGTHVAGIVSAKSDNGLGIASVGFDVAIMPVKINHQSSTVGIAFEGLIYAANAGADIINCSWGGYGFGETQKGVIEYAQDHGCIIVCAAGNSGEEGLSYPAAYDGVLSVGATTKEDKMAPFSNYGASLSITAPGYQLLSTMPGNQYMNQSGTSMSAPLVSGLLALMKSHYPEATNAQLKTCLLSTADSVYIHAARYQNKTGAGRINARRAMACMEQLKSGVSGIANNPAGQVPLMIYPNPAGDQIRFSLPSDGRHPVTVSLINTRGQTLVTQTMPYSPICSVSVSKLPAGIYMVVLKDGPTRHYGKVVIHR